LLHVGSPNIAAAGLRHTGQTVVMSGSNGTLEARWDGSTPPVSKIVGIRRGQSAAEELAVPDSHFAGADRADRSASLRVSPQGQNSACFEDVVERGLGRHSHLREAGLEQDPV